ncbi:heparinase II/III-family protein [Chitinophagaceae bacterium LB-8]|uniref:Heparinase II/III-family protein n=1 Tax=Paraflavisolibacter caeni TaxID=2982496 RepID=A0A9X2Y0T1_9BACT|nr:heparinase II/III family protein [Paraflavisolibacter caeni]MCU7552571.1 heparinase II/III-family protein [Paraflavisolibacter caeni]
MKTIAKTFILILLLSGSTHVNAQLAQRNLFQSFTVDNIRQSLPTPGKWHPFPTTAKEWQKILPDSVIRQYIVNGEKTMQEEFPDLTAVSFLQFTRNKNRSQYESIYSARRYQLFNLMMAELMEGKGRFNDKIANEVWAICEESFWGLPAHIQGLADVDHPYVDLFAAETASQLAWIYYFLGDNLDQVSRQLKPRIVSEVTRRIFNPMLTASWFWMGGGDPNKRLNNWAPWIMSNYITTALLLEKDEAKRAAAVKRALNTIDQYLNGLGNDGAINEGPIYWFASVGCVFDALSILHNASADKISIYDVPFLKNTVSYIYKMHIADKYFVNIGDATVKMDVDGVSLYRFGKAINDPSLMAFGSQAAKNVSTISNKPIDRLFPRRFFNLVAMDSCVKYERKYTALKDAWMADIQMMCSRSDNGFFVSSHGGHNAESHNHNDVGDFNVYLNGKPLLLDAGRGTYSGRTFSDERYTLWFNTSGYHNLPEVNGIQQKDGEQYAAKAVQYVTNNNRTSLSMDIAGAYPSEAGIEIWKRTVALYKKGWVEISDAYALKTPAPVSQHLMTVCDADISRPGIIVFTMPDKTKARLLYDAATWNIEKQAVVLKEPEDEDIRKAWEGQTIIRISLNSKKPVKKGTSTYRIQKVE